MFFGLWRISYRGAISRLFYSSSTREFCFNFEVGKLIAWNRFVLTAIITSVAIHARAQEPRTLGDVGSSGALAPSPVVVPPELVHFEEATYPEKAAQMQLEGVVVLKLQVDTKGSVVDVKIVEPAGQGFDDAAMAAAQHFRFKPATRGGLPVASKITYRYKFVSKDHQEELAAQVGEVRGQLLAGNPPVGIPSAVVRLRSTSGEMLRFETDLQGYFVAPNLAPGRYTIDASVNGFVAIHVEETVDMGRVTQIKYTLVPANENAIEVTVRGTALHREVTHYDLSREELIRVPGTMGDAIHAVEAMPSVARAPAFSGLLIVRGAAPQDSQVFVEGTLVPRVFHYGSLSSVVPSEMIENLEFYPSNFSVRYGRIMGGVIEVGLRETNPDGKYHGSAQMDFINARANIEGPIPKTGGWKFMAGFRGTYVDRWLVPVLRSSGSAIEGMPRYTDYQMYLERKLPRQGVLRLGFFGASDKYVPIEKNPREWNAPTDSFGHFQGLLRTSITSSIRLKASWSMGVLRNTYFNDDNQKNSYVANLSTARAEFSTNTGKIGSARIGTDLIYAPFRVTSEVSKKSDGGVLSNEFTDDPQLKRLKLSDVFFRPSIYGEYEFVPSRTTNVTSGIRVDHTRETNEWSFSPRMSARHALGTKEYSPIVKGGIGLFYQPPQPGSNLPEIGTPDLKSERAIHFLLGVEQKLSERVSLSVDAFEKELRQLITIKVDGSGQATRDNSGIGRVYGVDLLLRYRSQGRFFGWVAYTLSRSTRSNDSNEPSRLFIYDQTHILNLLASYRLGKGWEVGGRFRYMSGFLYDAYPGGLFDNSTGNYMHYGVAERRRMDAFHQLDIRIEKAFQRETYRYSIYLDVINTYFRSSPDFMTFKYDLSQTKALSLSLPLLPSFGIRGEF
jgi:TonB family protein